LKFKPTFTQKWASVYELGDHPPTLPTILTLVQGTAGVEIRGIPKMGVISRQSSAGSALPNECGLSSIAPPYVRFLCTGYTYNVSTRRPIYVYSWTPIDDTIKHLCLCRCKIKANSDNGECYFMLVRLIPRRRCSHSAARWAVMSDRCDCRPTWTESLLVNVQPSWAISLSVHD